MKNRMAAWAFLLMMLGFVLAGCGRVPGNSGIPAGSAAAKPTGVQKVTYQLRNDTGVELSEVYFYETGSDQRGENLAAGLSGGGLVMVEQSYDADTETAPEAFTVEYVTVDGARYAFTTLHFEDGVVVGLNGADGETGATVQPVR